MENINRFFRKYLLKSAAILILFFILNIVLIFCVLIWAWQSSSRPEIPLRQISESITLDENGTLTAADTLPDILDDKKAWAMMLDDSGQVFWQECMPDELPRKYAATDIAKFNRWYLQDYPVYVLEHPAGLLVIGCEPNSIVKYNFALDVTYLTTIALGIGIVIIVNVLLIVLLFWRNTRNVEKAVVPILNGIETISQGNPIDLPAKGELAEINIKLINAGDYLIKKDNTRAEWIRGVSHDIRTPLSMILGYSSEMEDNPELPAATRKQAGIIREQSEKLRALVSDLNLTTKLEYSMQPIRIQAIDPLELLRQVISEFLNNGLPDGYELELSEADTNNITPIYGDVSLLNRMLQNLIQNSITHNPNGCQITASVRMNDGICSFCVIDTGCGISESYLALLNNDVNIPSSQEETAEGEHGLGLKIVQQIVKVHQGNIQFSNINPHGLKIEICLPQKR